MTISHLHSRWSHQPATSLTPCEQYWLFAPGSLTRKLKDLGTYSIELISQYETQAGADDANALNIALQTPIWVREVLMRVDGQPCVTARSIAPSSALQHDWAVLANYGGHPLGNILYQDPAITRHPFEWASLASEDPLSALSYPFRSGKRLLARRSRFIRLRSSLVISECFLPAFWAACASYGDEHSDVESSAEALHLQHS
ncbi:chorismate--pyruvate lyase family protein [Pseudomonas fluorescens]|uniref:chorismate--pyruvate lyase family protein n=1 Tax=Pseudomonas fluorescens TaxID=294 RepID=UPI00177D5BD0|nr:chorismate lyase [Pseudomonas fluorescens]